VGGGLTEKKKTKSNGWPKSRLAHSNEGRVGQAWRPEKEEYYRSHVGELVNIEV
jgi:hypothetical protein